MKHVISYLKKNYIYVITIIMFMAMNAMALQLLQDTMAKPITIKLFPLMMIALLIVEIVAIMMITKLSEKKVPEEKIFLWIGIFLGAMYMVLLPIGRASDEQNHFWRAYEISEGHLLSDKTEDGIGGRNYPISVVKLFFPDDGFIHYADEYHSLSFKDNGEYNFALFPGSAVYSPITYIPQASGILIGRILSLPTILVAYLGRIFNFITWIIIMYYTIKLLPFKKHTAIALSFLPISMQGAISLSADALINSTAFLLFAFVMHLKYTQKTQMTKWQYVLMIILSIVISMSKIVYLPLCLLLFLIPKERFKDQKKKNIVIFSLAFFVIMINLGWLAISSSYLIEIREGVNGLEQVKFILTQPFDYIHVMVNSFIQNANAWMYSMLGGILSYVTIHLSYFYIFIYLFILIYLFALDNNHKTDHVDKKLIALITIATTVLILTSLYVQWTPVKNTIIEGVQGRYFIPLLLGVALLCNHSKIESKLDHSKMKYIYIMIVFINLYALMTIFYYHI